MDDVGDEVAAMGASEGAHLQSKESSYPLKHGTSNMLVQEMVLPGECEDMEHSPHTLERTLDGEILNRSLRSVADLGHHAGPRFTSDDCVMVEELTLRKNNNSSIAVVGPSTVRDRLQTMQDQWQHLCRIGEGSCSGNAVRDASDKDNGQAASSIWEDSGFSVFHELLAQNPLPCKQSNCEDGDEVTEQLRSNDSVNSTNGATTPGGIRTKVLSSSGFSEYFVKNTLKGKGIIYWAPAHDSSGVESRCQSNSRAAGISVDPSAASLSCTSNGKTTLHEGISLREWLENDHHRINKVERLCVFRQIVDLVDAFHSKGVVLPDLRPSCFKLLPLNQVKYIGSFICRHYLKGSLGEDNSHFERDIGGKRQLDAHRLTFANLGAKKQKFGNITSLGSQFPISSFKLEIAKEMDIKVLGPQNPSYKEHNASANYMNMNKSGSNGNSDTAQKLLFEEKWYTSPEACSEKGCSFSSNIYCLGVLLFELLSYFDSGDGRARAMSDLRHRILPPSFLSENTKEAGFCLWLLHPEPSLRPTTRNSFGFRCIFCMTGSEILSGYPVPFRPDANQISGRRNALVLYFVVFKYWHYLVTVTLNIELQEVLQSEVISGLQDMIKDELPMSIDFEQEDAESELLLDFLVSLKEKKRQHASKLVEDIRLLTADAEEVARRHLSKRSLTSNNDSMGSTVLRGDMFPQKEPLGSDLLPITPLSSTPNVSRLMGNFRQLESAYFSMRSNIQLPETDTATRTDNNLLKDQGKWYPSKRDDHEQESSDCLSTFFDGLCKYARYSKFEVCGALRNVEFNNSANVICSLSFDRDQDYFAAAGMSKKIKIFEFKSLFNDSIDIHYPVIEIPNRSRLSCICWNNYIKNYLASTDYDGIVKKNCLGTIRNIANVCCVQFSAHSAHLLAFGSSDYKIYCYDLRNARAPWCTLAGHDRAVSYVRFLDSGTLVSASTDSTLKIWDLSKTSSHGFSMNACHLTLRGHTNEKNFVGLTVADGYIACGSETNEVYAYYRSLPMPITSHKFGSIDPISGKETDDDAGQFVSSVCWRAKSNTVVSANSTGCIKLLQLV
ncbi:WD40 repeat [Dillenia turbinata]|uniref:WD40 repeat n=1 Tax=Dillenia turbinata TaxID=194707 RepID=A0AAN8ZF48_9MAGN